MRRISENNKLFFLESWKEDEIFEDTFAGVN